MQLLLYLVYGICFFVVLATLDIVWTNVKAYAKERNFQQCFIYIIGGTAVISLLIALTDVANNYLATTP